MSADWWSRCWPGRRLWAAMSPHTPPASPLRTVLSVYRDHGVVLRDSRDDNVNRLPQDLQSYQGVRRGDIVVNRMKAWQGSLGVSPFDGLVSPDYEVLSQTHDLFDDRYLHHLLRSRPMIAEYGIRSTGIRPSQWRLYWASMKNIRVPVPTLAEQTAIADYLDRETAQIDELITEQHRLIDLLRERKDSLIAETVSRGLNKVTRFRKSGLRWCAEVPEHWTVANLRRFAQMRTGHTPSRRNPQYWADVEIPWFTLADVWQIRDGRRKYLGDTASKISELGLANSAAELLPAGTVVLSRTASVGFTGIMSIPMATSQDFWNWIPTERLDATYLMWAFRAMRPEFDALMIGSTHKTIYRPTAAAISIPVPPLDEQRQIADSLDEQTARIDAAVAEGERLVDLARERRAALITAAVTGQIDVPDRI